MTPAEFKAKWRDEAAAMRRRKVLLDGAALCDEIVADFDIVVSSDQETVLNLEQAARESGYSADQTDNEGRPLLMRNPLHGLPYPREETPRRPIVNDETYLALLAVSAQIDPMFQLGLELANATGHRIGAISMLRWSDIDFENETVRWRATHDKIGFEHQTPMSPALLDALQRRRKSHPFIGDSWIFMAPGDSSQPCSRHLWRDWWQRGEQVAGIVHQPGMGWHSLRRKFATEMKNTPLKDLCYMGGWKEPQTILKCYQRADMVTMREALANRTRLISVSI